MKHLQQQSGNHSGEGGNIRSWGWLATVLIAVGCFAIWLFVRQIAAALGMAEMTGPENAAILKREAYAQIIVAGYLLLSNGLIAGGILLAAGLFGCTIVRWILRTKEKMSSNHPVENLKSESAIGGLNSEQIQNPKSKIQNSFPPSTLKPQTSNLILGVGFGLAAMSLAVFLLGLAGIIQRWVYILMLTLMAVIGLPGAIRGIQRRLGKTPTPRHPGPGMLLYLLLPLAALMVLAALVPAGIIWKHDDRSFDALEYHLQLPREYIELGRIERIDHNVFSNFPANTEMLYMLAMVLRGDAVEGMYLAQLLNLAMGFLIIAGVAAFAGDQRAGLIAAAAVAVPQWAFVATNAYVECYMLLMFLLSAICLFTTGTLPGIVTPLKSEDRVAWPKRSVAMLFMAALKGCHATHSYTENLNSRPWVRYVLAGFFVGAACGSKYTALAFVLPVILGWAACTARHKIRSTLIVAVAAMITLSPWLIKNMYYCGNPIFPLAANRLDGRDFTPEQIQRWDQAHRPAPNGAPPTERLALLAKNLADPLDYGGLTFVTLLALILTIGTGAKTPGLAAPKRSVAMSSPPALSSAWGCHPSWLFLAALAWQIIVWLLWTHLQSRFLLPIIIPAGLLIARRVSGLAGLRRGILLAVAAIAVVVHTSLVAIAYNNSTRGPGERLGFHPSAGMHEVVRQWFPFGRPGQAPPPNARVLLVGESRPFYIPCRYIYNTVFDQSPWLDLLQSDTPPSDIIARLRQAGVTHIFINWHELARLQKYYHYAPNLTRQSIARLLPADLKLVSATPLPPELAAFAPTFTPDQPLFELYEVTGK
jgi:hypothetical protein